MTQSEYKLANGELSYILRADEGCEIVRVANNESVGDEIWLGYRFTDLEGHPLPEKILEKPEDFYERQKEEEKESSKLEDIEPIESEAL